VVIRLARVYDSEITICTKAFTTYISVIFIWNISVGVALKCISMVTITHNTRAVCDCQHRHTLMTVPAHVLAANVFATDTFH
jgi:hypothetical protein